MAKLLRKLLSTMIVLSSITGMSSCQLQVSDFPIKIVENEEKLDKENEIDYVVEDFVEKEEVVFEEPTHEMTEEEKILQHYSSREQVERLLDEFGADSDILYRLAYDNGSMRQTIRRLEHNMGEPIRVAISPTMSQWAGEIALEEVDKMFNLVGKINSNYTYEVVEYSEDADIDIVFKNREGPWAGMVGFLEDEYRGGCAYTNKAEVNIHENAPTDPSKQAAYELDLRNTVVHELMHVFGFGDVYIKDTNKLESTTLLAGSLFYDNRFAALNLTPNDYKNLVALYAEPSDDLENDIAKYQQMVDDYYQNYYMQWAADNFKKEGVPAQGLSDGVYSFSKKVYTNKQEKTTAMATFNLEIKGNNYVLNVVTSEGVVLESTSGSLDYLNMHSTVNGEEKEIQNAVAIFEGFGSRFIHEDIYRSEEIKEARSNIVLYYNSEGKLVLKEALGNVNKAAPEYQMAETEREM